MAISRLNIDFIQFLSKMKLLSRSCQTVQIMKNRPQKSLAGVRTASTNFRSRQLRELIIVTISCQLESVCFFVAVKIDRGAVDHIVATNNRRLVYTSESKKGDRNTSIDIERE